jgi:hypothetical protein
MGAPIYGMSLQSWAAVRESPLTVHAEFREMLRAFDSTGNQTLRNSTVQRSRTTLARMIHQVLRISLSSCVFDVSVCYLGVVCGSCPVTMTRVSLQLLLNIYQLVVCGPISDLPRVYLWFCAHRSEIDGTANSLPSLAGD